MDLELPPEARALLDAVVAIGTDLDLRGVLTRIVEASCELTEAEYGVLAIFDEDGRVVDLVPNAAAAGLVPDVDQLPQDGGRFGLLVQERTAVRIEHVADHPAVAGASLESHPPIDRFLDVPVLIGDEVFGHLSLGNGSDRRPFTAADQALVEALARTVAVMIDHARTYEQTEFRRRWLDLMSTVASRGPDTPSGTERVHRLLGDMVDALRDLCDAGLACLVMVREGGVLEVQRGSADHADAEKCAEELGDHIRRTADDGVPVRVPAGNGRAHLVVPVRSRLDGDGALIVHDVRESPSLRAVMLDMMTVSADRMALILDRDRALRDRAKLIVAKDRDRIARDLHDLVIQRLFATGMQLQAGKDLDPDELRRRVTGAVEELDATISELRSTIFELNARSDQPLSDDVRGLLAEYTKVLGFRPVLRVTGPVDRALAHATGAHVLSALREALSNVARHAEASMVTVELRASPAWFALRVTDDGAGFDPATVEHGRGSDNLRTRAEELGGHLTVSSAPGQGATLEWVVPALG